MWKTMPPSRKGTSEDECRRYAGIEQGLIAANSLYINMDKRQADSNRKITEFIIRKLINMMRKESPAFRDLYVDVFGAGSVYEGLKITKPDEFDLDILMQLPLVTQPLLRENNIPGYVNLQLQNFQDLQFENHNLFKVMQGFVDENNYLLTKEMKGVFMQSIFDRTVRNHFPDNVIVVGGRRFKIRMQSLGPAFTLTVEGRGFRVLVDLVPCILLDGSHWPGSGFEPNPYADPSEFFLVPKSPKRKVAHVERYWRLSFRKQEIEMMFDRQWMKPTIRILKRLRDCFGHKVSSYALKTICLKELERENPNLDDDTPRLWLGPWSYCVVHILKIYLRYLRHGKIPYFWNEKLDLLDNLSAQQIDEYGRDITRAVEDIEMDPSPQTILKYLKSARV